jgi:hypothetical protein
MRARPGIALLSLAVVLWATVPGSGCTVFDGLVAGGSTDAADAKVGPRLDATSTSSLDAEAAGEDAAEPGQDAAPPMPPDAAAPPPGYLSVADAVRACSLVFSCKSLWTSIWTSLAVPADQTNFSLCVDWLAGPIPLSHPGFALQQADLACIANATTCKQAGSCLSFEKLEPTDPICNGDAGESCLNSTTILICAWRQVWHCDNSYYGPGQQCLAATDGFHWCAESSGCSNYGCIGNLFYGCFGTGATLQGATSCAHGGESCGAVPDAGGLYSCLTDGQERFCTSLAADCNGAKVEVCDTLYVTQFDCAELGGTCSKAAGVAGCRRPSDSCTVSDPAINACQADGKTLSLCVGGHRVDFDCTSLAGKACLPKVGGTSAHCG